MYIFNIGWFEHILQSANGCSYNVDSVIITIEQELINVEEYKKMLELYQERFIELKAERDGQQMLFEETGGKCHDKN